MRARAQHLFEWGSRLAADYGRTRASLAAGGLAYFVALSIAPAALAFGAIAGIVLSPEDVRAALEFLADRAPDNLGDLKPVADALVATIANASSGAFTLTTVISVLVAAYAASKVVFGLRMAMNTVFSVNETRSGLVERGIATVVTLLGMVAAVALVILLTIVPRVAGWLGFDATPITTVSIPVTWVVIAALVFVSVRWIIGHAPDRREPVGWLSPGPWVATLGIVGSTVGVDVYARFSTSLGAAVLVFGTAVVILLWLYLCFVALLLGAIIEADGIRTRTSVADRPPVP